MNKLFKSQYIGTGAFVLLSVLFAALAYYRLVVLNSDVLYLAQDLSYWQPGALFLQQSLAEPGGIFSWAGCYLTQFLHEPVFGSSLLIIIWVAIAALLYWGCRLQGWLCWLAFVPSMILLWSETSLGYNIYLTKAQDWCFAPSLFVLVMSVLVFVLRWFPRWWRIAAQVICLIVTIACASSWLSETKMPDSFCSPFAPMCDDQNFHHQIRMQRAADEGQWKDVLIEMRQTDQLPTRAMIMYKNMALLYQDRLHTDWLTYETRSQLPTIGNDSIVVAISESIGPQIYFLHGSIGFSYRWAMENMVEYGHTAFGLRTMTRCALIMGEDELANRYLNLLSGMHYQREWAENHRRFIGHPELLADDPYFGIPLSISRVRPDLLDGDNNKVEKYLLDTYSTNIQSESDPLMKLNMMFALQSQDIRRFWNQFFTYASAHKGEPMPRLYQEAAWLYGQLEPQSVDVSQMPFDKEVIETHQRFLKVTTRLMQQGMSEQAMANSTRREFGQTFFWNYFFCRGIKLY